MGCGCKSGLGLLMQKKLPAQLTYGEILSTYLDDMKEGNIYSEADLLGDNAKPRIMLKHLWCMDAPAVSAAFAEKKIKVQTVGDLDILATLAEKGEDVTKIGFSVKEFIPTIQVSSVNLATCSAKYVD